MSADAHPSSFATDINTIGKPPNDIKNWWVPSAKIISGLYYKPMIVNDDSSIVNDDSSIVNDDSSIVNELETSLNDDARVVIF